MNTDATTQGPLFRSRQHRSIGGVCAGIALARGWSISLVRTVALWLLSFAGFFLYLIAWAVLPNPESVNVREETLDTHDPFRRSRKNRKIAGVCGGVAELLKVDATLVRVLYIFAVLCCGLGLISYAYAWMIVPEAELYRDV